MNRQFCYLAIKTLNCQREHSLRGPAPLQGHPVEGSGAWPAYVVLDVVRGTSGEVLVPRDRWSSLGSTSLDDS